MFDFHIHSRLSFDSEESPENIIRAAESLGLREICFADHYDLSSERDGRHILFSPEEYRANYGNLHSDKVKIRLGVEFGLTTWNQPELDGFVAEIAPDFVIGSVHSVGGIDPYCPEYWEIHAEPFEKYLLTTLDCVKAHDKFDVLGHLNYVCKSPCSPHGLPLLYSDYSDICDEIMKTLAQKGRGMEINTSGIDRVGVTLPSLDFLKRFRELGGEIVTIGSDAHDAARVGKYSDLAVVMAREVFGYVCTFEKRKPIFHKL